MDKLNAYSDEEEDARDQTTIKSVARSQEGQFHDGSKHKEIASNTQLLRATDEVSDGQSVGTPISASAVSSVQQPVTESDLAWLAPPPARRRLSNGDLVEDPEWGLGLEKRESENSNQRVDPSLAAKLAHFHDLKQQGVHFNQSLSRKREFRNPHIYAKLVDWVEVDETASAYADMVKGQSSSNPDRVWRASTRARRELKREANAERLAELQRIHQEEVDDAKSRGKRSNIDFVGAATVETTGASTSERGSDKSTAALLEAKALAERRAKRIRQDIAAREGDPGNGRGSRAYADGGRHQRERHRISEHRHEHRSRDRSQHEHGRDRTRHKERSH